MKSTAIEERIKAALLRHPEYANSKITKNLNNCCSAADVQRVRESLGPITSSPESHVTGTKGIPLQSKRVTSFRPVETAAKFIKRLPKGRGFNPKDLAAEWGMSEDTIKKHAKDMKCMKYVEITEDEWVPMIMHPETAAQY
jgi:hypothetical protein